MKTYKIVRVQNRELLIFTSYIAHGYFAVTYRLGKKSVPKLGSLFGFNTINDCLVFLRYHPVSLLRDTYILECEGIPDSDKDEDLFGAFMSPVEWMETMMIHNFWNDYSKEEYKRRCPDGTRFFKEITPLVIYFNPEQVITSLEDLEYAMEI